MKRQATPDELKNIFDANEAKISQLQKEIEKKPPQAVSEALNKGIQELGLLRIRIQAVYGYATTTDFTVELPDAPVAKKKGRPKLHLVPPNPEGPKEAA